MRKLLSSLMLSIFALVVLGLTPGAAQERRGTITGHVTDATKAVLKGAQVNLTPSGQTAVTDDQGQFIFSGVAPGRYKVTISAVGFATFASNDVAVPSGGLVNVDAVLQVEAHMEVIEVRAEREHGEVEAINRERTAENILQVLPAEVITSLPNANIADALGRMPSVTIERDEGEGKYVQIRGTQPRLSNVTIDGINVPSPEGGVRQIKLDTVASDLVESVEINKTLQANQDGDGIGGSVNLRTKTAGDVPTAILYGLGGYTPIHGGRGVDQFGGTLGQRFGAKKQWGVLFGGTYDWNGRGIHDVEPSPDVTSVTPKYTAMDQRDYNYYRTRWGLAGSADYKLNEGSDVYLRGLYSTFRNWGHKWVQSPVNDDNPSASQDWRRPDFAIGSLVLGARHLFSTSWVNWDVSVARSRQLSGFGGANYAWNGPTLTKQGICVNIPNPQTQFRPLFSSGCFTPGAGDITDMRNYVLQGVEIPASGLSAQLNLGASASYAKQYHLGTHYGTFEFGGKIRNAHKFDDTQTIRTDDLSGLGIPAAQFLGSFLDPGYYDKTYHFTNTTDYIKARDFALANSFFKASGINGSNFNLIERVSAGYLMNSLDLTHRLRLVAGVRFEATHVATESFNGKDAPLAAVNVPGGQDYLDILPSVSLRIGLTNDSALRTVYSRGLSRPDPQDISQVSSILDNTVKPNVVTLGNPNLKAEHSDNFDLLFEQYLKPVGMIQAGFFYKNLTDPIVNGQFAESPSLFPTANSKFVLVQQVQNVGSSHVLGFEIGYTQHLRFLPGVMKGAGISANYSRTSSEATGLQGLFRSDNPPLQRQAPNTWNISPTFDTKRFSMRVGMTYNDAMIFFYQFKNLHVDPAGVAGIVPLPACTTVCDGVAEQTAGGAKGPFGDNYLYSHFQLDVQASYKITHNLQFYAYGLNLNNEVFGFYNGSPQYVVQREYYHPTYAGGIRWTLGGERSQ